MNKLGVAQLLVWSLAALSLIMAVVGLGLIIMARVQEPGEGWVGVHILFGPSTVMAYALVGALVAARQPRNAIGWIFSAVGLSAGLLLMIGGVWVVLTVNVIFAGIAILRHRLYDINLIINRTLVYGTLSAGVAGMYVVLGGMLGTLSQSSGNFMIALLATGLAAFIVQPLRVRLQRSVNRLMYGDRDDPYTVLSRLSQQLKATLAPSAVLPAIAETVARTLKLPYVAISLRADDGQWAMHDRTQTNSA